MHRGEIIQPIYRPIQYLGSKLRSLDLLLSHTNQTFGKNDLVVDCFSGSSVVSQAFANSGARVIAIDSLLFCQHIASAMLGVSRTKNDNCANIAHSFSEEFSSLEIKGPLAALLRCENELLAKGPSNELVEFYMSLPQIWRPSTGQNCSNITFDHLKLNELNFHPIISSNYAGTYFGLRQAIFFDYIRTQITKLSEENKISIWTTSALLTALYSAMSSTVCSAGKHFAQPLAVKSSGNVKFRINRLHTDRSIDSLKIFKEAAKSVDKSTQFGDKENIALATPFENTQSRLDELKPRLLYADPPYTSQQYSRFYHVLEVTANYKMPEMQLVDGKVTSGLYNVNRYKSPFSSKIAAPGAFNNLANIARNLNASLAISYSASTERSTGNSRMINLPDLIKICEHYYGNRVKVMELNHTYRPFNSDSKSNIHRNDIENLIVCET